ncbi:MAG: 2Fe-2S iron-sulfur cluster-binding protein [Lutispora sp.]|nr:2Fe-2S iron-sulfur cluster-binding protein [Lutispora sp.]MDD4834824.1 2Fe-2S iron-sulfur cluster-binding protein [Lutispora sp.]
MKITIDGIVCEAQKGEMLLQIARRNNIFIPTLCHSDALPGLGSCRLCMAEVMDRGRRSVVASCIYPVKGEIEVFTHSDKIKSIRRNLLMLLYARAPEDETINKLRKEYGVPDNIRFSGDIEEHCILCGLCVKACEELGSSAISTINRGVTKKVATPYDEPSSQCIGCGACAYVCPTNAIKIEENDGERTIWNKTFQLVRCERCGKPFATREQLEYSNKKLGTDCGEALCEVCKKAVVGEKLKDIYERTT